MASSRVGLRIRTFIVLVRGTEARASINGMENAKVLPVPVCAVATTSRPSRSGGMACAWTGVGVTNSFFSRLFRNAEQRLSSEKCCINCVRFYLRRTGTLSVLVSAFRIAACGCHGLHSNYMLNRGYAYTTIIGGKYHGQTLLSHLASLYRHSTPQAWQQKLNNGEVTLDGVTATGSESVAPGQTLVWNRPPWREPEAPQHFEV